MTDSAHQDSTTPVGETPSALAPRRAATFDDLMKKKRRTVEFTIPSADDANESVELVIRYRAIGSKEYDDLVAAHPPTSRQAKDGAVYNPDTFAAALVSAVSDEPKMSVEQAQSLLRSPEWAGGEVGAIFITALKLQNAGLNVPFTADA